MLAEVPLHSARDRLLLLRSVETFQGVDDVGIMTLADNSHYQHYAKGDVVQEADVPVDEVQIVVRGGIDVVRANGELFPLRRGFAAGILELLAERPGRRCVATEDTTTLNLPAAVVFDTYEENFSFVRNSLRLSASSLLEMRSALPRSPTDETKPELGHWRDDTPTFVERIIKLREGFFGSFNTDAVIQLARGLHEVRFEPGDVLWSAGDEPHCSYTIAYGIARCTNPQGESVRVGADFVLGVFDPLADRPRAYDAVAETKMITIRNSRGNFLALLETHHDLARMMMGNLARSLLDRP